MCARTRDALTTGAVALLAILLFTVGGLYADEAPPQEPGVVTDVEAYLRFQALARTLPPADASRAFTYRGRILRAGVHVGTWAMQAKPEGGEGDWRIEEIIRIDGELSARRKVLLSSSLYPIHGSAVVRRTTGATELVWRGDKEHLVLERTPAAPEARLVRERFGAVALSGVAPYVLIGMALCEQGGRFRTLHVYDSIDGQPQIAARDLQVQKDARWGEQSANLLVFGRPWPATIALHPATGALLGLRVPTKRGLLEVEPFTATPESESAWDLLTAKSSAPAIAALRFLYALERGYLSLAETLVAWPPELSAPAGEDDGTRAKRRRAWIEARRIELLADLPPDRAAQQLQALLPLAKTTEREDRASVRLPAPYDGWVLECEPGPTGEWGLRATRRSQDEVPSAR